MNNYFIKICPVCGEQLEQRDGENGWQCPSCLYCDDDNADNPQAFDGTLEKNEALVEVILPAMRSVSVHYDEKITDYYCHACGVDFFSHEKIGIVTCPVCGKELVCADLPEAVRATYRVPCRVYRNKAKKNCDALLRLRSDKIPHSVWKQLKKAELTKVYVPCWMYSGEVRGIMTYANTEIVHLNSDYNRHDEYQTKYSGQFSVTELVVAYPEGFLKTIENVLETDSLYAAREPKTLGKMLLQGRELSKFVFEQAMKNKAEQDYKSVSLQKSQATVKEGFVFYALYPVWILSVPYKEKQYYIAVNGITGRTAGQLPLSKLYRILRYILFTILILIGLCAGAFLALLILTGLFAGV